jgi:hypothetical protein
MDAFSEIFSGVKLSGALFFSAEFSAPSCFASPASNTLAPLLAPGAPHLVIYHFVIDGAAFVQLPDGQSIELGAGDIVVLPHGDPHVMTSAPGSTGEALTRRFFPRSRRATCVPCRLAEAAIQRDMFVGTWLATPS